MVLADEQGFGISDDNVPKLEIIWATLNITVVLQALVFLDTQMMCLNQWPPIRAAVAGRLLFDTLHVENRDANLGHRARRHLNSLHIHAKEHNVRLLLNRAVFQLDIAEHDLHLLLAVFLPLLEALPGRQLAALVWIAAQQRHVGAEKRPCARLELGEGILVRFDIPGPCVRVLNVEAAARCRRGERIRRRAARVAEKVARAKRPAARETKVKYLSGGSSGDLELDAEAVVDEVEEVLDLLGRDEQVCFLRVTSVTNVEAETESVGDISIKTPDSDKHTSSSLGGSERRRRKS